MKRRTLLKAGLAGGALLAVGAASILVGRDPLQDRATVMRAVAPAMLDGALPREPAARSAALERSLAAVDAAIASLAPSAQAELGQLFALLASAPGRRLLAGVAAPWESADIDQVAAFLASWRGHRLALFKTGYAALHDLVLGSWYADPSTWAAIGYPGPLKL
jgi:hypothetical protein